MHNNLVNQQHQTIPQKKKIFGEKRPKTYKSYCHSITISIIFYISFVYIGYVMSYFTSIKFQDISNAFSITLPKGTAQDIFTGLPSIGACFGAIFSRFFIQKFSRNKNFIICNSFAIIAGILVLIPNTATLFMGRLLQGFCVGFFGSITPMTVKQISPIQLRGVMTGLNIIGISVGYILGYSSGWISSIVFQNISYKYTLTFGVTFILSFLQLVLITVFFPYQTPKYLLLNGRFEEARQIIVMIYKPQYHQRIMEQKMLELEIKETDLTADKYTDQNNGIQPCNKQVIEKIFPLAKTSIYATVLCLYLELAQQMTGSSIILIYSPQIARQYFPSVGNSFTMIIYVEKLISSTLSVFLVFSRIGRKPLFIIGQSICALSLYFIVYGIYKIKFQQPNGDLFIFFATLAFIFAISISIGPLTWMYIPEVLQPNIIPYIVFFKWFINFVGITLFTIIREKDPDCTKLFLTYFLFTFVSIFIFQYALVETKDKNQLQIRQQMNKKQTNFRKVFCECVWFKQPEYKIHTQWNED